MTEPADPTTRTRIVAAAADLIAMGGRDAATTRSVAEAAGVQAPTIYRLFGDKRGLLDAVVEHGMATYMAEKAVRTPDPDPFQDLRDGWDSHIAFCLAHPGLFAIMTGDPHPRSSSSLTAGMEVLRRRVRNIARAGRLRMSEERAIALIQSMGTGTVIALLSQPEHARDAGLSAIAREALLDAIAGSGSTVSGATVTRSGATAMGTGAREAATALRASLDDTSVLSGGERHLLGELLDRIADEP